MIVCEIVKGIFETFTEMKTIFLKLNRFIDMICISYL